MRPALVGGWVLPNRVWTSTPTVNRADADGTPNARQARSYAERAGAGLIVSEGTWAGAGGRGGPNAPALRTARQQAGWERVADAVHAERGKIVVQLTHAGTTDDRTPPRAPETDELPGIVAEFAHAAELAVDAGVDGVELQAGDGHLPHRFQADGVDPRTDAYGGSPENRARFTLEVAAACVDAIGADHVGVRISPGQQLDGVTEDDLSVYEVLVGALAELDLAYLHVAAAADDPIVDKLRGMWPTTFVLDTGVGSDDDTLADLVEDGRADAVTVGTGPTTRLR
ncbi:alkene reductase [Pseudonocardia sp. KRD-291]|nr:alkene reductase [Pseudonocardia sp. KRD291]